MVVRKCNTLSTPIFTFVYEKIRYQNPNFLLMLVIDWGPGCIRNRDLMFYVRVDGIKLGGESKW